VFFIEPDKVAEDDALLVQSIRANGRVFLETVFTLGENPPGTDEEFFGRQDEIASRLGTITRITGDWVKVNTFLGLQSPLKPYGRAAYGYGHANFLEDPDQVYRRQPLVVKLSRLVEEIPLEALTVDQPLDRAGFERLAWIDKQSLTHDVPWPLTAAVLADLKKQMAKSAPPKRTELTPSLITVCSFHTHRSTMLCVSHDVMAASMMRCTLRASSPEPSISSHAAPASIWSIHAPMRLLKVSPKERMPPRYL